MKKIYLSLFTLLLASSVLAQNTPIMSERHSQNATLRDSVAERFSKKISAQDLSDYLHRLASDEFEGRETGQPGQKKAAKYIAQQFASFGIPPLKTGGYFQEIPLTLTKVGKSTVGIDNLTFKFATDFYYFSNTPEVQLNFSTLKFLGYGIKDSLYNDYKNVDVKNKAIMVLGGEPVDEKGNSLVTKKKDLSEWSTNLRKKMGVAKDEMPSLLMIVVDSVSADVEKMNRFIMGSSLKLIGDDKKGQNTTVLFISKAMANVILAKSKTDIKKLEKKIASLGKPYNMDVTVKMQADIVHDKQAMSAENVLAYVEGTDLKDEVVVVTGHYDHLGKDGNVIFYGADDDGSGTSAVIEMAKVFNEAKKAGKGPRRSMLFMTVSGEEKGLLGSEYYSEHPVFPLEKTVADLNIDMIGRLDEKHKNNPNYVYVIGSDKLSTQLHAISENTNKTYANLELDYTYNDPNDPNRFYFRSDHYNFAKHNIPVIFYFNGVHADYHKSTDTVEKIDFFKMEKITRLVFFTAWDLANRNERIKVDVTNAFGNK
jgi:hypothetical protein